jgi:sugar phosphate isomerase/epimerase
MRILMFTKMLKNIGNLPIDKAADIIAEMGFEGADLTVREEGYVLPEDVLKRLPEVVDIIKSKGLSVPMITTNITDAKTGHAEEIFKMAAHCDVEYIKLGYWKYAGFNKIKKQIDEVNKKIDAICSLSENYSVTATIHIHAGPYMSADPALLYMFLKDRDPDLIGAYIDPGHMFAELGAQGWEMAIDLLAPYIRLIAAKNYRWVKVADEHDNMKIWKMQMLPLKEEIVPWPELFKRLKEIGFNKYVSIHSEYEDLDFQHLIFQTREDLGYLKTVLKDIY